MPKNGLVRSRGCAGNAAAIVRMNRLQPVSSVGIQRAPVRLLTLTTLFPNSRQPRHGIFVADRLRRLRDTGRGKATVVAALPWFPSAYRQATGIPSAETACRLHLRYRR